MFMHKEVFIFMSDEYLPICTFYALIGCNINKKFYYIIL